MITSGLWIVDVATGERTPVEIDNQIDAVHGRFSPDGRRIAFWGLPQGSGRRVLFTVPADGGSAVALTDDDHVNWNPVWSPDGASIYFLSDRGGAMNLWRVPSTGRAAPPPVRRCRC